MKDNKEIIEQEEKKSDSSGIQLNKKTLFGITALLLAIMIFAGVLTRVVPHGAYDKDANGAIIAGSYHEVSDDEVNYPFWRVFIAPLEVFTTSDSAIGIGIIAFIILVGGTFFILEKSGVLKYILQQTVNKFSDKKYLLMALIILICMCLSSVMGMLEECVTLVPLACAISLALGWDSLVGLGFSSMAIVFGYAAATFNPFNVVLIQSMAGLPLFSGLGFRVLVFIATYLILFTFLFLYAKKIEKNPQKSLCYETDKALREKYLSEESEKVLDNPMLPKATKTFVMSISGVVVLTIISFIAQRFIPNPDIASIVSYTPLIAMAVLFTFGGLRAGSIAGIKGKKLLNGFMEGVKTILPCVPLILFILGITYILNKGMIIDTILYYIYEAIKGFSPTQSLLMITAVVIIIEFFVGSGTAKAFLLMPLILPLVDLLGITRQSLTLAFTMGDGYCNILYPTSAMLILSIGLINVSYTKFIRWSWKVFIPIFATMAGFIWLAVKIGY
ncbi:MAG: AbgT family transporter [Clostridia bacterium]|nr:AbgT family transporter [Clostridia bacterium]